MGGAVGLVFERRQDSPALEAATTDAVVRIIGSAKQSGGVQMIPSARWRVPGNGGGL